MFRTSSSAALAPIYLPLSLCCCSCYAVLWLLQPCCCYALRCYAATPFSSKLLAAEFLTTEQSNGRTELGTQLSLVPTQPALLCCFALLLCSAALLCCFALQVPGLRSPRMEVLRVESEVASIECWEPPRTCVSS